MSLANLSNLIIANAARASALRGRPGVAAPADAPAPVAGAQLSDELIQLLSGQLLASQGAPAADVAASCGCNVGTAYQQDDGYLPVAGGQDEPTAAGPYEISIQVQGRPIQGSKLMMQSSAGIFSVTEISIGDNDMQFGKYIAGFALDPRNQIGFGIELNGPAKWFEGVQTVTISGTISAAATIQAQIVSNDPEAYKASSCGPVQRGRRLRG